MALEEQLETTDMLGGKVSKKEANYRPVDEGGDGSCEICMSYEFPGNDSSTCVKVAGTVYAEDTCDLWEPTQQEASPVAESGLQIVGLGQEGL